MRLSLISESGIDSTASPRASSPPWKHRLGPRKKEENPFELQDSDYEEMQNTLYPDDEDDGDYGDYVNPNDVEREKEKDRNSDPYRKIKDLRPSCLIDDEICEYTIPFIGSDGDVFIGNHNEYHADVLRSISDDNLRSKTYNAYGDNGVVGRIGYNLDRIYGDFPVLGTIRARADMNNADVAIVVQELINKNLVSPDTPFVVGSNVVKAQDLLGAAPEVSDEDETKSRLAVMLHLGADQYGRRLDAKTKQAIMRKLGMETPGQVQNKWQQGLQKAGMQAPGQKYWAPTSESFIDNLTTKLLLI